MSPNLQGVADLVTLTDEILMENFIFCAVLVTEKCLDKPLNKDSTTSQHRKCQIKLLFSIKIPA